MTAPTIIAMLMIRPAGLRHSFDAVCVVGAAAEVSCRSGVGVAGGVMGASIGFQLLKQKSHTTNVHMTVMQT